MHTEFSTALLKHVSDPLLIAAADGSIYFANDSFQALAGWTRSLVGHPVQSVIKTWDGGATNNGQVVPSKAMVERLEGPPVAVDLHLSVWQSLGETYTGAIVRSLAEVDELIGNLKQQQDQADAVIEEVRVAHKLLEEVVEMLPQAVCVFDAQDRYLLWNQRYSPFELR